MVTKKTPTTNKDGKRKATRPSFEQVPVKDAKGKPMLDSEGNPKMKTTDKGKHDRFVFYATLRVNKAIQLFRQLSNLKNKTIYS